MTEANQYNISISKKKKKLILAIFASFLLVATIIAIVTGVNPKKNSTRNDAADYAKLVKSTFQKNDFLLQVNRSIDAAQSNKVALSKKLAKSMKLDVRQRTAINDCWENNDRVVTDLKKVFVDVKVDTTNADQDLNTKFASCMTGVNSCLDGFSHSKQDKKVREALSDLIDVRGNCTKALEMIKSKPTADTATGLKNTNRKLKEDNDSNEGGAEWLSVTDRRLFQLSSLTPDVVVAADGSGNYKTVSAAVAAAPKYSSKRYIIRIKAGVYRENVEVPKEKSNIMFLGDGRKTTIITGSRNVVGGSTTYHSATVGMSSIHAFSPSLSLFILVCNFYSN
jgi:pectinesterase